MNVDVRKKKVWNILGRRTLSKNLNSCQGPKIKYLWSMMKWNENLGKSWDYSIPFLSGWMRNPHRHRRLEIPSLVMQNSARVYFFHKEKNEKSSWSLNSFFGDSKMFVPTQIQRNVCSLHVSYSLWSSWLSIFRISHSPSSKFTFNFTFFA